MKRQWRVSRTISIHPNAQQRWDQAYHLLLQLASPTEASLVGQPPAALPTTQEVPHASSCLCPSLDLPPGPPPDD
jgi:hypothetical protein